MLTKIFQWVINLSLPVKIAIVFLFLFMDQYIISFLFKVLGVFLISTRYISVFIGMVKGLWLSMYETKNFIEQVQSITTQGIKSIVTIQIVVGESEYEDIFTYYIRIPNQQGNYWIFKSDRHPSLKIQFLTKEYTAEIYFIPEFEFPVLAFVDNGLIPLHCPEVKIPIEISKQLAIVDKIHTVRAQSCKSEAIVQVIKNQHWYNIFNTASDATINYYFSIPNGSGKNWIFKVNHLASAPQFTTSEYSAELYFSQDVEYPTLIVIEGNPVLLNTPEVKIPRYIQKQLSSQL